MPDKNTSKKEIKEGKSGDSREVESILAKIYCQDHSFLKKDYSKMSEASNSQNDNYPPILTQLMTFVTSFNELTNSAQKEIYDLESEILQKLEELELFSSTLDTQKAETEEAISHYLEKIRMFVGHLHSMNLIESDSF